jgi:hypothetical protein
MIAAKRESLHANKGGAGPRRKGAEFEREVVAALQELGIAAERVPTLGPANRGKGISER